MADRSRPATYVPARFTVDIVAAVPEPADEGMAAMWDRIHDALDAIPGAFSQGGGSRLMPAGDLIAGSPLDQFIREVGDAG